jgi:glycerol-3-phosphate dehydrogenase subunit B
VFLLGDSVIAAERHNSAIRAIVTQQRQHQPIHADWFVLATGGYFSNGLIAEQERIREPIFDLAVHHTAPRTRAYSERFFERRGHDFLRFGVKTNQRFNPFNKQGELIENLFCAGAVLAHYHPIEEGCGGGVAIATGYQVAKQIMAQCGASEAR